MFSLVVICRSLRSFYRQLLSVPVMFLGALECNKAIFLIIVLYCL